LSAKQVYLQNTLETGNAPHDLLSNETTLYDAECYR